MRRLAFVVASLVAVPSLHAAWQKVSFAGEGGVELAGSFSRPASPGKTTIILLHGLGSGKEEWRGFAELCAGKGYGVLIYDQRGHGQSRKSAKGETVDYQRFYGRGLESEWGKMIVDLGSASDFLQKIHKISPRRIAVGGASIGANVALRYAVKDKNVAFVLLLSPGMDYQGIQAADAIAQLDGRPAFLAASPTDGYSYQSVQALQNLAPPGSPLFIASEPPGSGHGVQMFRRARPNEPSPLETKILGWFETLR